MSGREELATSKKSSVKGGGCDILCNGHDRGNSVNWRTASAPWLNLYSASVVVRQAMQRNHAIKKGQSRTSESVRAGAEEAYTYRESRWPGRTGGKTDPQRGEKEENGEEKERRVPSAQETLARQTTTCI